MSKPSCFGLPVARHPQGTQCTMGWSCFPILPYHYIKSQFTIFEYLQDVRRNKFFPDEQNDSSPLLFDRQFTGSARLPHTACPTPLSISRHKILHKNNNRRGLPRWMSELGRWFPPKQVWYSALVRTK